MIKLPEDEWITGEFMSSSPPLSSSTPPSSLFDGYRVRSQPSTELAQATPYQLRGLVLDYLAHQGYTKTAAAFARDSTVRHLDADGDEIMASAELPEPEVRRIELRDQIHLHIQCGHVEEATSLLNAHFPTVLQGPVFHRPASPPTATRRISDAIPWSSATSTDNAHITLNLHVLAFIEACRTRPLLYPDNETVVTLPHNPHDVKTQLSLLNKAQKLFAQAEMLPNPVDRALYSKELKNIGGLLAYKIPENSTVGKYLRQERRDAVAEQIHCAILEREGVASISSLELLVRYTTTLWYYANKLEVKPRPGTILPSLPIFMAMSQDPEIVSTFDLGEFLDFKR